MNTLLKEYFALNEEKDPNKWLGSTSKLPYSGNNLIDEINALNGTVVLDLGCGNNIFKDKVHNLIGIDITNTKADYVMDFMDFECADASVDVILNLGAINFGTIDTIMEQFGWIHRKLKPGGLIFIRANSSIPPSELLNSIFFKWDTETIVKVMHTYNLELIDNKITLEIHRPKPDAKHRMVFKFRKM